MEKTKVPDAVQYGSPDVEAEQLAQNPAITPEDIERYKKYAIAPEELNTDFPGIEDLDFIPRIPIFNLTASGLYEYSTKTTISPQKLRLQPEQDGDVEAASSIPVLPIQPFPIIPIPIRLFHFEQLRLDVDGRYPQMTASGRINTLFMNVHWIAKLTKIPNQNSWQGSIWYKRGSTTNFKYTHVKIDAVKSIFPASKQATVTFSGTGVTNRVMTLKFKSTYLHNVEFEYDYEEGITPLTTVQTHAHPNRPASLPNENLSIETVFRRSGFNVKKTGGDGAVPAALKGSNGKWSDQEMHDAMQTYWSKFANIPQWSLWTFFAKQHDLGSGLGGIMFDDIGPNHRQGTAIFYDSFIANAPSYDTNKPAWVNRMKFWTAVHEMGHAFNLAHSWQKTLGTPWIPSIQNEPQARSFMNYPYYVTGGESAFFANFEYRFSDQELLFMRHAPYEFVQQGNAKWFDNHGFEWANTSSEPSLMLEARVHRRRNEFEFLEPVNIELKLKNVSNLPVNVDESILKDLHDMLIVVKRNNDPAKQYNPFATRCFSSRQTAIMPGESIYESVFLSAGKDGWLISEPGYYSIQICIHTEDEDYVSNTLKIRVNPPKNYEQSYVAQDYFENETSRVLAFDGSLVLGKGNDVLREVADRLKGSRAADYANLVLARPLTKDYKLLDFSPSDIDHLSSVSDSNDTITVVSSNPQEANKYFAKAVDKNAGDERRLSTNIEEVVETVGHIESRKVLNDYTKTLLDEGKKTEAVQLQENLLKVYETRGIIETVRNEVEEKIKEIKRRGR
jgi:hypothetical protein